MIMTEIHGAKIKDAPFEGEPQMLVLEDLGQCAPLYFTIYTMPEGHDLLSASKAWQVFWIQMFTIQAERVRWD